MGFDDARMVGIHLVWLLLGQPNASFVDGWVLYIACLFLLQVHCFRLYSIYLLYVRTYHIASGPGVVGKFPLTGSLAHQLDEEKFCSYKMCSEMFPGVP